MSANVYEGAMRGQTQAHSYELQIQQVLDRVTELVAFVGNGHFALNTLQLFWRQETRAQLTVQTIGRLLARPLADELHATRDLLERALPYDIFDFSTTIAPTLFGIIQDIQPHTDGFHGQRTAVEQLQYAAEVRQALLHHVLGTLNVRYQPPRFRDLVEASHWTAAYSATLQEADAVIQGTRTLLKSEMAAAQAYLRQVSNEIEAIETAAEARFGIVKRLRWSSTLEEAETLIHNILADRAELMESVTFAALAETKNPSTLTMLAQQVGRTAPKLALLLLGIASTTVGARMMTKGGPAQVTASFQLPALPNPLRALPNPQDTARLAALNTRAGVRPASYVSTAVQQLTIDATARQKLAAQSVQVGSQVRQFFDRLPNTQGRQTIVIQNRTDLQDFVATLTQAGYQQADILSVLGIPSLEAFNKPLTVDLRKGREMPILFPYSAEAQVTAPNQAVAQVNAAYQVRPGDTVDSIARVFGLTADAVARANPTLATAEPSVGQTLSIPGPLAPSTLEASRQIRWGDTLGRVSELLSVPVEQLATLNNVGDPVAWRYAGGTLNFPATAPTSSTLNQSDATQAAAPTAQPSNSTAIFTPLQASEAYIVYRVQPEETIASIASRYGTTIEQLVGDNSLSSQSVMRGQNLLIRRPSGTASQNSEQRATVRGGVKSAFGKTEAIARKSATSNEGTSAPTYAPTQGQAIAAQYGETLFPSLDAMPEDARGYFLGTVKEVGTFFNVRPGDIMGIMRLEQNNAGWRLQENRTSSVGASGVGQIVPRTWNGWANDEHDDYVRNVLDIEEHGGLGFDWSKRDAWRTWQQDPSQSAALIDSNADPDVFENSVAGVARHLVHWGLTNDFAERDPEGFAERLADAIAVYNSGRTLDVSADWTQSADNQKTTAQYVAEAMAISEEVASIVAQPSVAVASPQAVQSYAATFAQLFDQSFAMTLTEQETERFLSSNAPLLESVRQGKVDATAAAIQLFDQIELHYMQQGRAAIESAAQRPWPYIHDHQTLYAQKTAANLLGRPLTLYEIDDLMNRTHADRDAIHRELMSRADARLFSQAKHTFDQMLGRSSRGLPISNSEVSRIVQPLLAGYSPFTMDETTLQALSGQVQRAIQTLPEYGQLHNVTKFDAAPLRPMPAIFKGFGASVDYQAGGRHTGIDVANPRMSDGSEPPIYAVDNAKVAYVGPLYCEMPDACRGGNAIILDHGDNVYSIYSHNSQADVKAGQQVTAGQMIGRQGNEGYSFGSHLHFEVHTGAPFTGDWQTPFAGGEFANPAEWLP